MKDYGSGVNFTGGALACLRLGSRFDP